MRAPGLSISALHRWRVLSRWLSVNPNTKILEFGPGAGALGARLSKVCSYFAVEPDAVSRAKAKDAVAENGGVVVSDLEALPVVLFDVVCAFEVLEHIEDDCQALKLWCQYLRPGGEVYVSVPAFESRFGPSDVLVGHVRRYERDTLERLVSAAGLEIVDVVNIGFPLLLVTERFRNLLAARRARSLDETAEARTGKSGRWLQPSRVTYPLLRSVSWPFEILQLPFGNCDLGISFLVRARKSAS